MFNVGTVNCGHGMFVHLNMIDNADSDCREGDLSQSSVCHMQEATINQFHPKLHCTVLCCPWMQADSVGRMRSLCSCSDTNGAT